MTQTPLKPKKDFLYDVITHTIMFDNELEMIFREYFGLKLLHNQDGSYFNGEEVERFSRHFMQPLGSSSKKELLREIISTKFKENKYPEDFDNKFLRFYKIRNIFAHSMYPLEVNQKEIGYPFVGKSNWNELHSEHDKLYSELITFIGIRFAVIYVPKEEEKSNG